MSCFIVLPSEECNHLAYYLGCSIDVCIYLQYLQEESKLGEELSLWFLEIISEGVLVDCKKNLFKKLGMGVVTLSSSASRTSFGLGTTFTNHRNTQKRSMIVAFKGGKSDNVALVTPHGQAYSAIEAPKRKRKKKEKNNKLAETVKAKAVATDEYSSCATEVDYNEAAAKLEDIYRLDVTDDTLKLEEVRGAPKGGRRRRRNIKGSDENEDKASVGIVVRNENKKSKRLGLDTRIALSRMHKEEVAVPSRTKKTRKTESERIDELVREYSAFVDAVSMDWKKMKMPPVLSSSEQNWLFKLMQPVKVCLICL